jgi:hypothetical protein
MLKIIGKTRNSYTPIILCRLMDGSTIEISLVRDTKNNGGIGGSRLKRKGT